MRNLSSVLMAAAVVFFMEEAGAFSTPQHYKTFQQSHVSIRSSSQRSMGLSVPEFNNRRKIFRSSNGCNGLFQKCNILSLVTRSSMMSLFSKKLRRTLTIFFTSAMLILGPLNLSRHNNNYFSLHPQMAHASTTTISQSKIQQIVDEYVQRHMFNDEMYDPVESTYRETILDINSGEYPSKLSDAASSALGKKLSGPTSSYSVKKRSDGTTIMKILRLVDSIQDKTGLSRGVIISILFLVGCGIPVVLALGGLMSFSYNQKAMTERMAIQRYGESVLDAEERVIVEDEDDDYDYDKQDYTKDEDGGDDDDEEEEDDDDE